MEAIDDWETGMKDQTRHHQWEVIGTVFRALGSPLRVGIVELLDRQPRSVGELVEALDVSQPLVSQHLRVLRSAGLVRANRRGREMIYELTDARAASLVVGAAKHPRDNRSGLRLAR